MSKNCREIVPKFYCNNWVKEHNYLPEYSQEACTKQCDSCVNEVINHHIKKRSINEKE